MFFFKNPCKVNHFNSHMQIFLHNFGNLIKFPFFSSKITHITPHNNSLQVQPAGYYSLIENVFRGVVLQEQ